MRPDRLASPAPTPGPAAAPSIAALLLAAALVLISNASAGPLAPALVEVIWEETGSPTAAAFADTPLTAQIFITSGEAGLSSYGFSLEFDDDLMLASTDPLDADFPEELLPAGFQFNLTDGVDDVSADTVFTFEAGTFAAGPVSTRFLIGVVHFIATDPKPDGADVGAGFFNIGIDGAFDNAGEPVLVEFADAEVVPEPEAPLLAMIGLATLLGIQRRRRLALRSLHFEAPGFGEGRCPIATRRFRTSVLRSTARATTIPSSRPRHRAASPLPLRAVWQPAPPALPPAR